MHKGQDKFRDFFFHCAWLEVRCFAEIKIRDLLIE